MEEKQKLFEVEKEKELYESKVSFFTEIAHEVRTPLTYQGSEIEQEFESNRAEYQEIIRPDRPAA